MAARDRLNRRSTRLANPDRVTALSDGVFAIVLTILVLEIAVPENLSGQSLLSALEELRPTLVAWVVSFLITGMYWVAHRDMFSRAAVMRLDLYWYLIRRPALLWPDEATDRARLGLAITAAPILAYAVAMAVADASATLSIALFFAVPVLYFLFVTLLRARPGTQDEADQFS